MHPFITDNALSWQDNTFGIHTLILSPDSSAGDVPAALARSLLSNLFSVPPPDKKWLRVKLHESAAEDKDQGIQRQVRDGPTQSSISSGVRPSTVSGFFDMPAGEIARQQKGSA